MNERRTNFGRRIEDTTQRHCLDHSGLKTSIEQIDITVNEHSHKLNKVFTRVNATLISILLTLLTVSVDIIVRLQQII